MMSVQNVLFRPKCVSFCASTGCCFRSSISQGSACFSRALSLFFSISLSPLISRFVLRQHRLLFQEQHLAASCRITRALDRVSFCATRPRFVLRHHRLLFQEQHLAGPCMITRARDRGLVFPGAGARVIMNGPATSWLLLGAPGLTDTTNPPFQPLRPAPRVQY